MQQQGASLGNLRVRGGGRITLALHVIVSVAQCCAGGGGLLVCVLGWLMGGVCDWVGCWVVVRGVPLLCWVWSLVALWAWLPLGVVVALSYRTFVRLERCSTGAHSVGCGGSVDVYMLRRTMTSHVAININSFFATRVLTSLSLLATPMSP
jgi:hypothetical protein